MSCTSEFRLTPEQWFPRQSQIGLAKAPFLSKAALPCEAWGGVGGLEEFSLQGSQHSDLKVVDLILFVWGRPGEI